MTAVQLRPALALALWTFFVWTTRIRNIWIDDALGTSEQVWRTVLALLFTALALTTLLAWWRARRAAVAWAAGLVRAFAGFTIVVWVVRAVQIAMADHSGAFVAVHTALAVVSIGLAVWAHRATDRPDRAADRPG